MAIVQVAQAWPPIRQMSHRPFGAVTNSEVNRSFRIAINKHRYNNSDEDSPHILERWWSCCKHAYLATKFLPTFRVATTVESIASLRFTQAAKTIYSSAREYTARLREVVAIGQPCLLPQHRFAGKQIA